MAITFLKHRWQRLTFYVVAGVAIIALLLAAIFYWYAQPHLLKMLRSSVKESSDSLYAVNFDDVDINPLAGDVSVKNASLTVDTIVYQQKKAKGTAPNNLYLLQVPEIKVTGVNIFNLLWHKDASADEVILNEPKIAIIYEANNTEDHPTRDNRSIWQRMKKDLHSLRVGKIALNAMTFKHTDKSGKRPLVTEVKEIHLKATDLLVDSTTQADTSRLFYCRDIATNIYNYHGTTPDRLYTYDVKSISLSSQKAQLCIQGITLKPLNSLLFFSKTSADRYNLTLDSLQLRHFNFINYYRYRSLRASSITMSNGRLAIFNSPNKSGKPATVNKLSSFPHVALKKIKLAVSVDTLKLKNLDVIYSEYSQKSKKNGSVSFMHTSGRFLNITNNKAVLARNNKCRVHLTSSFMNSGWLNVDFTFNLTDKDAAFACVGSLGKMPLSDLNRRVIPLSMVKITSGTLKKLSFNIHGSSSGTNAQITMLYNDLKIGLLRRDEDDGKLKKKGLMSILANHLVIERNNPDDSGKTPRSAAIRFVRPPDYPFFKLVWKTLFAGIKECTGVSEMDNHKQNTKTSEKDLKKYKNTKSKK